MAAPRSAQTPAPGSGRGWLWKGMLSARRRSTACTALGITQERQQQQLCGWRSHLVLVKWLLDNSGDEAKNLAKLTLQMGTDTAHLKQLLCSTLLFLALHLNACMA